MTRAQINSHNLVDPNAIDFSLFKLTPGPHGSYSAYPTMYVQTCSLNKTDKNKLKTKIRHAIAKFKKSSHKYGKRQFIVRDWDNYVIMVARIK